MNTNMAVTCDKIIIIIIIMIIVIIIKIKIKKADKIRRDNLMFQVPQSW